MTLQRPRLHQVAGHIQRQLPARRQRTGQRERVADVRPQVAQRRQLAVLHQLPGTQLQVARAVQPRPVRVVETRRLQRQPRQPQQRAPVVQLPVGGDVQLPCLYRPAVGPLRQAQRQPALRLQRAAVVQLRGGQQQVGALRPARVGQLRGIQRQCAARQQLPAAQVVQPAAALDRQPVTAFHLSGVAHRRRAQRHRAARQRGPGTVLQYVIQRGAQLAAGGYRALIAQAPAPKGDVLRLPLPGLVYRRRTQAERAVAAHPAVHPAHIGTGQLQVAVVQPQQGPLIEQGVRRQCQPRCLPQTPVVQRAGGELAGRAAQPLPARLIGDVVTELCVKTTQRRQRAAVVELPPAQRRHPPGGQPAVAGQAVSIDIQAVQPGYLPPAGQRGAAEAQVARLPQPAVVGAVEGQRQGAAAQQPAVGPAGIARHPVQRQRRRALYSAGVVHRARPHRQRVALQVAGVAQRLRAHRGGPVAQQRPGRQIGQVSPAGDVQLRQPHQSPAVGQRAGGDLQPLAADVALLRHPVRRQRHRAVAPHLTAHAAGVALRQVQRHRVRRPQRAGVVQRPGVKPQVLPLPVSLMGHRPGLHPPVAVAEQLPARAHRQPVAQAQRAALLRQQRAAVIQTVAGQAQRAALHAAAVADVVRRQHQRAAGRQRARIVQRTTG